MTLGLSGNWVDGFDGYGAGMNANLRRLNATVMCTCVSQSNAVPASPALDSCYMIGTFPTGVWTGHAGELAAYQADEFGVTTWRFYVPQEGWAARIGAELHIHIGGAWIVQLSGAEERTRALAAEATLSAATRKLNALATFTIHAGLLNTPPASPVEGDSYIVGLAPTGAWVGHANDQVVYQADDLGVSAWRFYTPKLGALAWLQYPDDQGQLWEWTFIADAYEWLPMQIPTNVNSALGSQYALARSWPLRFNIVGRPAASGKYNLAVGAVAAIPANFVGAVVYDAVKATANTVVTVNRITGATLTTVTAIGTLTITPTSNNSVTLSVQATANLLATDVLQLAFPAVQDTTLADVSVYFNTLRP